MASDALHWHDANLPPYPGLRSFKRYESLLFFGRDRCIDSMADTLQEQRFLAVLGPSGSGKSSLVRSGLFAYLEAGLARKAGARWTFLDIQHPRCRPYRALARVTLIEERLRGDPAGNSPPPEPGEAELDLRQAELRRDPMALLRWWTAAPRHPQENLLLLVDQFEELFGFGTSAERDEVESFIDLLLHTASSSDTPVYVVLTMRSEFLGGCSLFPGFAERINRGLSLTPRMTRAECELAITGPAFGREDFALDPLLVNALLNDMNSLAKFDPEGQGDGAAGDGAGDAMSLDARQADLIARRADQLPLMQHVLNWLWGRAVARAAADGSTGPLLLTLDNYLAVGGLRGALSLHANGVLDGEPERARVAERLFRAIIDQSGANAGGSAESSAVRRPRRLGDIAAEAGESIAAVQAVAELYRADGLSILTPDPGEPLTEETEIDISHEAIIRQWDSLRGWIRTEADAGRGWQDLLRVQREEGRRGTLTGVDLVDRREWWRRHAPHAGWADRYGGGFPDAEAFLARSERQARRRRLTLLGGTAALVVAAVLSGGAVISAQQKLSDVQKQFGEAQSAFERKDARSLLLISQAEKDKAAAQREKARAEAQSKLAQQQLAKSKLQIAAAEAASKRARSDMAAALAASEESKRTVQDNADRLALIFSPGMNQELISYYNRGDFDPQSNDGQFVEVFLPILSGASPTMTVQPRLTREELAGQRAYHEYDLAGVKDAQRRLAGFADTGDTKAQAATAAARQLMIARQYEIEGNESGAIEAYRGSVAPLQQADNRLPPETLGAVYARLALAELQATGDAGAPPPAAQLRAAAQRKGLPAPFANQWADRCLQALEAGAKRKQLAMGANGENEMVKRIASGKIDPADIDLFSTAPSDPELAGSIGGVCEAVKLATGGGDERSERRWTEVADRMRRFTSDKGPNASIWRAQFYRLLRRFGPPAPAGRSALPTTEGGFDLVANRPDLRTDGLALHDDGRSPPGADYLFGEPRSYAAMDALNSLNVGLDLAGDNVADDDSAFVLSDQLTFLAQLDQKTRSTQFGTRDRPSFAPGIWAQFIDGRLGLGGAYLAALDGFVPQAAAPPDPVAGEDSFGPAVNNPLDSMGIVSPAEIENASFANGVAAAASAIVWTNGVAERAGLAATARPRLIEQAAALLAIGQRHVGQFFYGADIEALRTMAQALCEPDAGTDCGGLQQALAEVEAGAAAELAKAAPVAAAPQFVWTRPGDSIALGGMDLTACMVSLTLDIARDAGLAVASRAPVSPLASGAMASAEGAAENAADALEAAAYGEQLYGDTCAARTGRYGHARRVGDHYWLFANEAAAATFDSAPATYMPALGGYDLAALFEEKPRLVPVPANFAAFRHNDRLYLFAEHGLSWRKLTDAAMAWADQAFATLQSGGSVAAYPGESPILPKDPFGSTSMGSF